jgi:hypothetical protein
MSLADSARLSLRCRRRENETDVIGRETIGPTGDAIVLASLGEEIAIERVILGLDEGRLAPTAAPGDVMLDTGNRDASDARHGTLIAGRGRFPH